MRIDRHAIRRAREAVTRRGARTARAAAPGPEPFGDLPGPQERVQNEVQRAGQALRERDRATGRADDRRP